MENKGLMDGEVYIIIAVMNNFTYLVSVGAPFFPLLLPVATEFFPINPLSSSSVGWRYRTRLSVKMVRR